MQLSTIFKILASIFLLAFLASRMELAKLGHVLASASLLALLVPVAIQLGNVLISVKRWQTILADFEMKVSYSMTVRLTFIGSFFSLFLPSSIGGDFFRAYYMAKQEDRGIATTLATVFMDRSAGLFALLLIGLCASFAGNLVVHGVRLVWIFLLLVVLYLAANLALFNSRMHSLLARLLHRLNLQKLESRIEIISRGLATLIRNRPAILLIVGISLCVQFLSVVMVWSCAWGLGIEAPFSAFLVFVPLINLSIMVPLTINGFGLRESLYFLLFTQIGVNDEQAVALSLVNAFVIMMAAVPGAIFYSLHKRTVPIEELEEEGLTEEQAQRPTETPLPKQP